MSLWLQVHHDATDESEKVHKDSMIEKSLMITMISKHDCWHDSDLWCGMFYHGFSEAMEVNLWLSLCLSLCFFLCLSLCLTICLIVSLTVWFSLCASPCVSLTYCNGGLLVPFTANVSLSLVTTLNSLAPPLRAWYTSLCITQRLAMVNPGDKEDEVRQVAFSELTALTNSMFLIGLSAKEVCVCMALGVYAWLCVSVCVYMAVCVWLSVCDARMRACMLTVLVHADCDGGYCNAWLWLNVRDSGCMLSCEAYDPFW